ncbi:Ankyrin repeat [Durusdinium trenchii]|uniref:PH and SEC7 domain containing protein secG n=2 Tax=Durusdinium trenchii TaxID=1381693 RepID=A0ABP0HLL3_9DINO
MFCRFHDGNTALEGAAAYGHQACVEVLLQANTAVDLVDADGDTALHCAAGMGHEGIVEMLLRKRASTDIHNKEGKKPSDMARENGHERTVSLLTAVSWEAEKALLEQALDEERQEVQKLQAEKQSLEHALDEAQKQARDKAALASKSEVQKLQAEKQSLEHALDEAQKQVPLLPTMTDQSQQRHASDLAEQWAEVEHARFDLEQRERDLAFRDFALRRSEVRHRESERRQSAMRRRLEDFRVELEEAMADVAAHEEFLRKQRRRTAEAHAHARQMLDAARRMSTEVTGGLSHSVRSRSARSAHR